MITKKESLTECEEQTKIRLKNFTDKFMEYYPEPPTEFIELFAKHSSNKFLTNPVSEETEFIN